MEDEERSAERADGSKAPGNRKCVRMEKLNVNGVHKERQTLRAKAKSDDTQAECKTELVLCVHLIIRK